MPFPTKPICHQSNYQIVKGHDHQQKSFGQDNSLFANCQYFVCITCRNAIITGKVMLSQASVIVFTGVRWQTPQGRHHRVGRHPLDRPPSWTEPPWADTTSPPTGRHTPGRPSLGRQPLGRHPPPRDGYSSRRYASYWNAFLFQVFLGFFN